MIPKIHFVYSDIYDRRCKHVFEKHNPTEKYPEKKHILAYIKKLEKKWNQCKTTVLKELSTISGLSWREDIKCYVVGRIRPFSDPLSIRLYDDLDVGVDVLVHELIHVLLTQNASILKKYWINLDKEYPTESLTTKNHLPIHAIHAELYKRLFTKKRLLQDIDRSSKDPEYGRSWVIVAKDKSIILAKLKKHRNKPYTKR